MKEQPKTPFALADHKLVFDLLCGRWDDKGRTIFIRGEDERKARRVLVKMLLAASDEPIPDLLKMLLAGLAALFDTDITLQPDGSVFPPSERVLEFKFRSKRRRIDKSRNTAIATDIAIRIYAARGSGCKMSVETATAEAAEKFGVSYDTAKKIWARADRVRALFKNLNAKGFDFGRLEKDRNFARAIWMCANAGLCEMDWNDAHAILNIVKGCLKKIKLP